MKKEPLDIAGMHDGATPRVFKNAAKLRENMTETEIKLWDYLKTKPMGFKFRRQHPIAGYVLDFYCHKLRLSTELDGGYHLAVDQQEKDLERTQYLTSMGIIEMRFTNKEATLQYKKIVEKINYKLRVGIPSGIEGERKGNN